MPTSAAGGTASASYASHAPAARGAGAAAAAGAARRARGRGAGSSGDEGDGRGVGSVTTAEPNSVPMVVSFDKGLDDSQDLQIHHLPMESPI